MAFFTSDSFIFNGVNSSDFDLIICWFDEGVDASINGLTREIQKSESTKNKIKHNVYGTENTDTITFSFAISKVDGREILREESIRINQWLTSSPLPQLLKFNDKDSYMLNYYAVCTEINDKVIGGRLVGKELTFETNSNYAFQNKIEKTFDVVGEHTFSLINTSDSYDGIYCPIITISATSDNIVIENITDEKSVTLNMSNIIVDENGLKTIILNCENMTITDMNDKLVYASDLGWNVDYQSYVSTTDSYITNIYWFRLLQGVNQIKITGDCTFKIKCEFPRKAGCC